MSQPFNPSELGLTSAETEVFKAIKRLSKTDQPITCGEVVAKVGNHRTWVWRCLQGLINKGLVERYGSIFYRLVVNQNPSKGEVK